MDTMAPIRPTVQRPRCISLAAGPAAAAEARSQVRAAICAWDVPVDPSVAVLLTSELVTNAIMHEPGENIMIVIISSCGQLRVDVHDTSRSLPVPVDSPADAEAGRGLMLVTRLSSEWGFYRTPAGKAVYFTLAFQADLDEETQAARRAIAVGSGKYGPPTDPLLALRAPHSFPHHDHLDAMASRPASRTSPSR